VRHASLAIQTITALFFAAVFCANLWHDFQFVHEEHKGNDTAVSIRGKATDLGAVSSSVIKEERGFTVDILSVGSVTRQEFLHAQKRTFASHASVRNFFNVTERDDPDPDCHEKLTRSQLQQISLYCRNERPSKVVGETYSFVRGLYGRWAWLEKKANPVVNLTNRRTAESWMCAIAPKFFNLTERDDPGPDCHEKLTRSQTQQISFYCRNERPSKAVGETYRFIRGLYARWPWLEKKANPVGWMCAQQRPHAGMMKVRNHYKTSGQDLPDYLLVMDDDTYINMKTFEREFRGYLARPRKDLSPPDKSEPLVMAGCLVKQPVKQLNFTFPFGGFGTFVSRGALEELYRPIYCDPTAPDYRQALHEDKCKQLDRDVVKEKHYFKDGMSIMELMHAYVTLPRYSDVHNWDVNNHYCLHSDHVFGVFLNFYNISQHVKDPWYRNVPQARVWSYKDSEIYDKPRGVCKNSLTELGCKPGVEICHYATPQWMEFETKKWINH